MTSEAKLDEYVASAAVLHGRIITFDSHIDVPLDFGGAGREAGVDGPGCFDLVKAKRGGLTGAALSVHATLARPGAETAAAGREEQEERFRLITAIPRDYPDRAAIARGPEEFRAIVAGGRFAIVISLQNAEPLPDIDALDAWQARGVRMAAFTFIGNNRWADSARPYPYIGGDIRWGGLSPLGKQAIHRLNDLGVIIDVSQLSSRAFSDVLSLTRVPVIASHSAPRALVDVDRNMSDDELRAIRDNGGVVHVVGFAPYLQTLDSATQDRLRLLWVSYGLAAPSTLADLLSVNDPATAAWPEDRFWEFLHAFHDVLALEKPIATVRDYVDAIEHAIECIGIDHVGIGSDFNHASGVVGWMDVGQNLNVTAELLRRGYADADIAKLWGENFLRVWQQVLDGARA